MQWNVPRTVLQLAHRTCMDPHKAGLFGHCQYIKGPLLLYTAESRVVLVQVPLKQWLHLSAAQCTAKERKPFDAPSPQLRVLHYKQWEQGASSKRVMSSNATSPGTPSEKKEEPDPLQDKSISLYQRFKRTFRQYGKVLIPVHLITSGVWFGTFYYAAIKGVNVIPFLELIGLPDSIVNILKNSQSGNALTAYALFKIATPARYTVTLGGTSFTVKYLRSRGYMSTPPPVKEYLQDKMEETKELLTEKMEETKDRLTEKLQETKEKRKSESNYTVSSLLKSDYLKQRFKFVVFKKIPLWKNGKWHQVVMDVPTLLPLADLVSISQRSLPVSSPRVNGDLIME